MKTLIAIPITNGKLSPHFGHCEKFIIFTTDEGKIVKEEAVVPPAHEPGAFPAFLRNLGVNAIIAGGMGSRAQQLFAQNDIQVIIGVQESEPKMLVEQYLLQTLQSGTNLCDH